jgi:hypothetical protein
VPCAFCRHSRHTLTTCVCACVCACVCVCAYEGRGRAKRGGERGGGRVKREGSCGAWVHTRLLISRSHTPPSRPFFFHSLFRARVRACVHTYINTCMHAYIQKIHTYLRVEVKRGAKRAVFEFGFDSRQLRSYVDRLCVSHAHTHTHARADTHTHTHTHTHTYPRQLMKKCLCVLV